MIMTIEEKAKAYDEALERAREYHSVDIDNTMDVKARGILEYLFPELAESEDEKVRKALVEMVHDTTGDELWVDYNVHKEEALAWLEKQGEQKPQRMISAEAKEAIYGKPAYAWSEEDEKEYKYVLKFVDNILNNCGNKKDYEHCKRCYDWLKSLKERIGG